MYRRCAGICLIVLAAAAAAAAAAALSGAAPAGLRCRVNGTASTAAGAAVVPGCGFCVTFRNQLDGASLLLCGAQADSADAADAPSVASAMLDVAQLELLTDRRIARQCLRACGGGNACAYSEATWHNITDASGALIDTVLLGNATYYCCRGADFCNWAAAPAAAPAAPPASPAASASEVGAGASKRASLAPNAGWLQVTSALLLQAACLCGALTAGGSSLRLQPASSLLVTGRPKKSKR